MNARLPISLVVITLNEERNIRRCLDAADFCSDIVVIDSGSTDGTLAAANERGARIFHREWSGYRDQKNFGTKQATQPWVLCIDADEVVSAELAQSIRMEFRTDPQVDGYELNRHGYYGNKLINHSGWYPQWRLFLYRRDKAEWVGDEPHTVVQFRGNQTKRLAGDLYHYTYSSVKDHVRKNLRAADDAARAMFQSGKKAAWPDLVFRGPWAGFKSYFLQAGFLDGFHGFMIAVVACFYTFSKYALLCELQRAERSGRD